MIDQINQNLSGNPEFEKFNISMLILHTRTTACDVLRCHSSVAHCNSSLLFFLSLHH